MNTLRGVSLGTHRSQLNGDRMRTILMLSSANRKTGDVNHTVHLPADTGISQALKTGADESVCGDCDLSPSKRNICYINHRWLLNIEKGAYPDLSDLEPAQQAYLDLRLNYFTTRLGSMGDPASDTRHLKMLTRHNKTVGYTQQWNKPQFEHLRSDMMASVASPQMAEQAQSQDWRTYRIKTEDEPLMENEILCPHPRLQCRDCGLCSGGKGKNIAQNVHGIKAKQNNYLKLRGMIK